MAENDEMDEKCDYHKIYGFQGCLELLSLEHFRCGKHKVRDRLFVLFSIGRY